MSLVSTSSAATTLAVSTAASVNVSSSSFAIRLHATNYLAWKTQFVPLLNLYNLHGYIDGTTAAPPKTLPASSTDATPNPNPAYDDWFKKDQLLLSWLLSSLTEEVYPFVIGLQTSAEVWQALTSAFGSISYRIAGT
jgi:hypothetical protein